MLIRCDASSAIGLGHVVRCLALADELQKRHNCQVCFAMQKEPLGIQLVEERNFLVHQMDSRYSGEEVWLKALIQSSSPDVLVIDVRTRLSRQAVEHIREIGVMIVTLDDSSDRRLAADLAFYPPVPQVEQLDWSEFSGHCYVGWEWVILRPEFAEHRQKLLGAKESSEFVDRLPTLLVTMGGSDPAGLTLKAMQALETLSEPFRTMVVLGKGFQQYAEVSEWMETSKRHFEILRNVFSMPTLMLQADIALASFGVTAYELAALGVPSLHLCLTEDHAISSLAFERAGMAKSLGFYSAINLSDLAHAVRHLLINPMQQQVMRTRCLNTMLSDGCFNIASAIAKARLDSKNP